MAARRHHAFTSESVGRAAHAAPEVNLGRPNKSVRVDGTMIDVPAASGRAAAPPLRSMRGSDAARRNRMPHPRFPETSVALLETFDAWRWGQFPAAPGELTTLADVFPEHFLPTQARTK